jgi:1-deoxy-D-xylulose-5-phosphate reductoisomerase
MRRRVVILGSTGSVGTQSIAVIEHLNRLHARGEFPVHHQIVGLAARQRADLLCAQARTADCPDIALVDDARTMQPEAARVFRGPGAAEELVRTVDADLIIAAIVGAAGLPATFAALERGIDVALANKETLVAAGELVVALARRTGARLLPIDSEHAGAWRCLSCILGENVCPPCTVGPQLSRLVLTASGGPFRTWTREQLHHATPAEALRHPTWNMGSKVTIDSASLMNKALEVVEAHWLFGLSASRIGVVVHPQSLVHALAEYADGSIVAQLAPTDMRSPIMAALAWPHLPAPEFAPLTLERIGTLTFEAPDLARFPALALATRVIEDGGTAGTVLNAANEVGVDAFLRGSIRFPQITELVRRAMDERRPDLLTSLAHCREVDGLTRRMVARWIDEG